MSISAFIKSLGLAAVIAILAGGLFIYSGLYPVGADVRHYPWTHWMLVTLRDQSIARAASDIQVPDNLDTPERLLAGGADYNDMCAGCHLKPGKQESDFSIGLYPTPPNLSVEGKQSVTGEDLLKRQFWVIKHGLKASGMPAWGETHSEERIWNMVAFLQRLPELNETQYQILSARGEQGGHH